SPLFKCTGTTPRPDNPAAVEDVPCGRRARRGQQPRQSKQKRGKKPAQKDDANEQQCDSDSEPDEWPLHAPTLSRSRRLYHRGPYDPRLSEGPRAIPAES